MAYILIPFSLLLIKYYPEYGVQYARWSGMQMWIGVTLQKNGLGRLCTISAFFLIWALVRRWKGRDHPVGKYLTYADVLILIMALWLLKGPPDAYSATGIAALAVGLSTLATLLWMQKHQVFPQVNILRATIVLIISLGIITVFVGGSTLSSFASTLGRDETLTGRTEIWADLLPVMMQKPLIGAGFGGFWTPVTRQMYGQSEAHSGYLDVLLDQGFVGMAFLTMFLLSCCRKAHRALVDDYDWGSLWICFLLMALVHNITETSLNSFASNLTAVLLFLALCSTATTSHSLIVSREVEHLPTG